MELNLEQYDDSNDIDEICKGTRANNWGYNATSNFKSLGKESSRLVYTHLMLSPTTKMVFAMFTQGK